MKKLILLLVVVSLLLSGCGMQLTASPEKNYAEETRRLKMVKEHQILQLEVMRINAEIAKMQAPAQRPARQKVNVPELGVEGEFIPLNELPPEMQK